MLTLAGSQTVKVNVGKLNKMKRYLYPIVASALLLNAGCDTFFLVRAKVTDGSTGQPITGATAKLVLDKGVGEPDLIRTTGTNGVLNMIINEHSSAWATLTVTKPGYDTWSTQFQGRPKPGIVIRLKPKE